MAGYVARSGAVSGVLHPLEVAAVAVVGSERTAVVCVADLLHVDDDVASTVRAAVAAAVGTTADLVWVCATHTHSGPVPREVAERLVGSAAAAARDAVASTAWSSPVSGASAPARSDARPCRSTSCASRTPRDRSSAC
jgi:hypothetical protein